MTVLFTQTYRDSGFEGLIPMGVAYISADICEGKVNAIISIRKKLEEQRVPFVFNCKFDFCCYGHPDNGRYCCTMMGDAYKLPDGDDTVMLPIPPEEIGGKDRLKPRRYGLVSILTGGLDDSE
jgi:hypothetical protein